MYSKVSSVNDDNNSILIVQQDGGATFPQDGGLIVQHYGGLSYHQDGVQPHLRARLCANEMNVQQLAVFGKTHYPRSHSHSSSL